MLKFNLFILCLEIYAILVLLFEVELPCSSAANQTPSTKLFVSLLPLMMTILSKHTEGWSATTIPAFLCSMLLPMGAILEGLPKLSFGVLVSFLAITHANAIRSFPIKKLIQPTGPFRVGYKTYKDKSDVIYSVFYPTLNPTSILAKFIPDEDAWKKYREIAQGKTNFPPKWLFDVLTHFCTKLNLLVSVDAPIVSQQELKQHTHLEKFIPVVFSHGLGGSRNNYSSILTQLASQGHFVVAMDHQDNVRDLCLECEKHVFKYLGMRIREITQMINEISTWSGSLSKLFGNQIELDLSRLTVMGHSYGGCSAYKVASQDERVKHCVLFDPWMTPVEKEALDNKLGCSLLLFESGDWNEQYPIFEVTKRNHRVMEAQRSNECGAIYCKVPNSIHSNFCDDILLVGGVMKLLKMIEDVDKTAEIYKGAIRIVGNYYSNVIARKQNSDTFILFEADEKFPLQKYA